MLFGRMVYAFSRDGAMPFSSLWHKVNDHEVPIYAVWLSAFISFCMALTVCHKKKTNDLFSYLVCRFFFFFLFWF